jgi:hypothetical protein
MYISCSLISTMIYDIASYSEKRSCPSSTFTTIKIQVFWESVTINLVTEVSVIIF